MNTPAPSPVLLACAHGTRDERGQRAVAALVEQVAAALPEVTVVETWVDVQEPDLAARTAQFAARDAVVVPLLLSAGYHVFVDMARAVKAAPGHRVAPALGPDPRLATLLARRLREALGAAPAPADRVVMVAAGSSDPRAGADCERTAHLLAAELGVPVTPAYLSAAHPTVPEAVAAARGEIAASHGHDDARGPSHAAGASQTAGLDGVVGHEDAAGADGVPGPHRTAGRAHAAGHDVAPGRVLAAPYLLAPGFFHGRALAAGADVTAEPLLVYPGPVPPELVELVVEHYREAAAASA